MLRPISFYLASEYKLWKKLPAAEGIVGFNLAVDNCRPKSRDFIFISFLTEEHANQFTEQVSACWNGDRKVVNANNELTVIIKKDLERAQPLRVGNKILMNEKLINWNWLHVNELA
ncbi:hypothetical protein PVAND_012366 [Polypedilum vanderplanki]|uniref:Uncharacterized protein n=1 Tax=Polypedilum vanderplanki TaxID=319348 RepID=A0A9J6CM94_POLVA|nr:hypothetical protein PVAND_012366 [Polypedilum vanderplanki]